jgi:hypothetical protein
MKIANQNKLSFFVIVVLLTALASCKKSTKLVQSTDPLQMAQIFFVIPPGQTNADTTITVYCNVDSIIRAASPSFNVTDMKSVKVSAATISLLNADNTDNFANFSTLNITIASTENTTPVIFAQGIGNTSLYADVFNFPSGPTVELKNYFDATLFTLTFNNTVSSPTFIALNAVATISFTIVVGPN